jgi:hypothetical protein
MVSFADLNGIRHSVEVSASSLYEAVVLALVEFRRSQLTPASLPVGASVSVRVRSPELTHEVKVKAVQAWLQQQGKTPKEEAARTNLKALLDAGSEG